MLPHVNVNNVNYGIQLQIGPVNIIVEAKYNRSNLTAYITIFYTKI